MSGTAPGSAPRGGGAASAGDSPAVGAGDECTPGIDRVRVSDWLADAVPDAAPPFRVELIAAGGSNLTYRVRDAAGHTWALRRPPVTAVLATAHDMDREWRIMSALNGSAVPVPAPIARCDDPTVTGAPFYVMGFVEGLILRTVDDAARFTVGEAEQATDSLVDVQVAMHALDVDAIGLGDLARTRTGYVQRQLHRWKTQVERGAVRELPLLDELHRHLLATVPPESGPPTLVHGDYRFDNTVLGADCRVIAVLDWELATIGDPLADFAWSIQYWSDPGDEDQFLDAAPTLAPVFPRRAEVIDRYARRSGRDVSALGWFTAFSYWKMACIVEGAYARRLQGARGGAAPGDASGIARRVDAFLARAAASVEAAA